MPKRSSNFEKIKGLLKSILILGLGNFLPKFVNIVTLPIITGYLTKVEYGIYDLISVLASLILPIATLEIETAAFRFLIPERNNKKNISQIISTLLNFICVTSAIVVLITYFILGGTSDKMLICLYLVFNILRSALQQIVRGLGKNTIYSVNSVINAIVNMGIMLVFVKVYGMGLRGAIWGLIMATMASCMLLMFAGEVFRFYRPTQFSFARLKEMLAFSWPMIPNDFSSWVMYMSDRFVLSVFCGLEITAIYAVANKIPNLMSAVLSTFNNAWHENASIYAEEENIGEYYSKLFDIIFCFLSSALALLISLSPFVFKLLIRGEYDEALPQMLVLFISALYSAIAAYLAGIFIARKQTREIGITTVIAAIINITLDVLLVKRIYIWAASLSTLISYFALAVIRIHYAKKHWNMKIHSIKILMCSLFLILLCMLTRYQLTFISIMNIVGSIAFAIVLNWKVIINLKMYLKIRLKGVS